MSNQFQKSSAAAAVEVATVICRVCGESWSKNTQGFEEAERMIYQSLGSYCPSCQFDVVPVTGRDLQDIRNCQDMREVRGFLRKQIYGISDSIHELRCGDFDHAAEFVLAQFLYTVVPLYLLKQLDLADMAQVLADKYNLDMERG